MKSVSRFLRGRVALLILVIAALGSSLGLLSPAQEAQAAACVFRPRVITYYTDATHTTVVGQSGVDCDCNDFSWGVMTPFHTSMQLCCPVFTC